MEKQLKEIIKTIEELPNDRQRRKYLRTIGTVYSGWGRMVVVVGNKVLKVAYRCNGITQNAHEIETWLRLKKHHKSCFATIYKYDELNYLWIVQEKLKIYRDYDKRVNLLTKRLENTLNYYCLSFWETSHQVGLNKNNKVKVYDYGTHE